MLHFYYGVIFPGFATGIGATFIPATQRPDGTWRKARRVKDGYVPQEEVPLYESKGKQWAKGRSDDLPVGLSRNDSEKIQSSQSKEVVGLSKAAKKNAKKKKKQPQSADGELCEKLNKTQLGDSVLKEKKTSQPISTDPAKRLKNLKKKLREIDGLKSKIESGELTNPDKDQLEKIIRRDQVEREIEELELQIDD